MLFGSAFHAIAPGALGAVQRGIGLLQLLVNKASPVVIGGKLLFTQLLRQIAKHLLLQLPVRQSIQHKSFIVTLRFRCRTERHFQPLLKETPYRIAQKVMQLGQVQRLLRHLQWQRAAVL